jgi:hypothetical protein
MFLVGTALHVVVRAYEVKRQQHRHYLAKWGEEFDRALEEAAALSLLGKYGEANAAFARAKLITHKYTMFFDSVN